jgi:hypothetical protein
VLAAPRDDPLRERRADTWQTCDFAHVRAIDVDALTGKEWTGELGGAASGLL